MDVVKLIESLRKTDIYVEVIFTQGSCYRFHLFLKDLFPDAVPLLHSRLRNHVITRINENCYDISGIVDDHHQYSELNELDLKLVESWSFHRNNCLKLSECQHCEEPFLYYP